MVMDPIPKDIPLGLPAPVLLLEILVVVSFLMHILFVALMVGGSLLTVALELIGRKRPEYDRLAHLVGATVTVNKSLAVVLGVAPLLILNTLYTVYFYSANALTGSAWILVIPMVIAAFLLSYAHEYSWDFLAEHKGLHLALGIASAAFFLAIPLIFLANINLMLFPERWASVHGFLSALFLPNVLPRYLHFLTACVALTGLFVVWYLGRAGFPAEKLGELSRARVRRVFYSVALVATAAQLLFGPFLYITLPAHAVSWGMTFVITCGAALAVLALWLMWKEVQAPDEAIGRSFRPLVGILALVVVIMATGRHMIRETAVGPHRDRMAAHTAEYMARVHAAQDYVLIPGGLGGEALAPGEAMFRKVCSSCHAMDQRLVGPPLTEIVAAYPGDSPGIVAWARAPGRKRMDYPAMPAQNLPEDDLRAIAEYILEQAPGT